MLKIKGYRLSLKLLGFMGHEQGFKPPYKWNKKEINEPKRSTMHITLSKLCPDRNFAPKRTLPRLELYPAGTLPRLELYLGWNSALAGTLPQLELCPGWNFARGKVPVEAEFQQGRIPSMCKSFLGFEDPTSFGIEPALLFVLPFLSVYISISKIL